jgi:hypothetical protein
MPIRSDIQDRFADVSKTINIATIFLTSGKWSTTRYFAALQAFAHIILPKDILMMPMEGILVRPKRLLSRPMMPRRARVCMGIDDRRLGGGNFIRNKMQL